MEPDFSKIRPAPGEVINTYHRCAQAAAAQAVAYAILCGLELQKIREQVASKGGRPKNSPTQIGEFSGGWENWIADNCDFSTETARKYMAVAEGVKGRLAQARVSKELGLIVDVAPSSLDQAQRDTLIKSVSKVTQGETLQQLYLDFGITKGDPHANLRNGGATHTKGSKSKRNLSLEDAQEEATSILISLAKFLQGGNHQHLPRPDLEHFDQQLLSARETLRPFLKTK